MPKEFLTDLQVEKEIAKLTASEYVKLARREQRLKYKRRQMLYNLRVLENRGKELAACGIDIDSLEEMMKEAEGVNDE